MKRRHAARGIAFACLVLPLSACGPSDLPAVRATAETAPVANEGDAADDPAIWVNERDPAASTVIGTDKTRRSGGLIVYALDGQVIQRLPLGSINNVDVRTGFPLGDRTVTLVTAGNRDTNTLVIYAVEPSDGTLVYVAARSITTQNPYGSCTYRSARTGSHYYFVTSELGHVEQWELFARRGAKVDARKVRAFDVGDTAEGCVADDDLGHLYVGEEEAGIWKYSAEADGGDGRVLVDAVGSPTGLAADVEGLTIAAMDSETGYLVASNQSDDSFAVYRREGANDHVASFRIGDGDGVDGGRTRTGST